MKSTFQSAVGELVGVEQTGKEITVLMVNAGDNSINGSSHERERELKREKNGNERVQVFKHMYLHMDKMGNSNCKLKENK